MPLFKIETNLSKDQIPDTFLQEATQLISSELGKPASYVAIQVCPDQVMSFGGTSEPCANISLNCIGVVCPDKNRALAPVLSKFVEKQLGIKQESVLEIASALFLAQQNQRQVAGKEVFRPSGKSPGRVARCTAAGFTSTSLTFKGATACGMDRHLDKVVSPNPDRSVKLGR